MTALLLHPGPLPPGPLMAALRRELPDVEVRVWPACGEPGDIDYALVSRIPPGELAKLPKLRLVASLHAGVDHLLRDPLRPAAVPLVRPAPPNGDALMNEYVLAQVLRHHREMPAYALDQRERRWSRREPVAAARRKVGVLGLGAMGLPAALLLQRVGFDVAGWVRSARGDGAVRALSGADGLHALLERSEIIVNLLPLTPHTEDLIDAAFLQRLPRGAALVNVGRGEHVVDADLLAALDDGQLSAATLDVFRTEPLPAEHPFWVHPRIALTPHACRRVSVDEVVAGVADNIRRLDRGEALVNRVDPTAGY